MKRCILVTLFLSFFGFSSALAYDACNIYSVQLPCTFTNPLDSEDVRVYNSHAYHSGLNRHFWFYSNANNDNWYYQNGTYESSNQIFRVNPSEGPFWVHQIGDSYFPGVNASNAYYSEPFTIVSMEAPPETPHFRYPVDYTLENNNGWDHKKHSYGSLNNAAGVPHAAEDWNKITGGCTDAGEPLSDIADGTVIDIDLGSSTDGWGKTILIQHDAPEGKYFLTGTGQMLSTVYSLYAHMLKAGQYEDQYSQDIYDSSIDIQQQESVDIEMGDPVGQVGDGDGQYADACHLHFEILTDVNQYRENPYGWTAVGYRTNPSELIDNGLYSAQSTAFSIIVHPYECSDTFQLNDTTPNCNGSSSTIGNWTRRGGNYNPGNAELGYNGIIYSKSANDTGTASWTPNLPRDGQYRVRVYVPNSTTYASSENAEYVVTSNSICYNPQSVNQSANHGIWVDIGTYDLYQGDTTVSLDGDTDEVGKVIAIDAIKFEYVGSIQ